MQARMLDSEKSVHNFRRSQLIFSEGDPAEGLHCIYRGAVKLYKAGVRDEEQVIRILGPGDIIGYRALFAREPYAATAEAIEPCTVCVIPKATVFAMLQACPEASLQLLALLSRELRISEEQMLIRTQESVRQRTARVLLWLAERGGGAQAGTLRAIVLKRRDIAQLVATTPETLSRCLRVLVEKRVVTLTRSEIRIADVPNLRALVRNPGFGVDVDQVSS
jgi:CRP-like cAMP-binding protein